MASRTTLAEFLEQLRELNTNAHALNPKALRAEVEKLDALLLPYGYELVSEPYELDAFVPMEIQRYGNQ